MFEEAAAEVGAPPQVLNGPTVPLRHAVVGCTSRARLAAVSLPVKLRAEAEEHVQAGTVARMGAPLLARLQTAAQAMLSTQFRN